MGTNRWTTLLIAFGFIFLLAGLSKNTKVRSWPLIRRLNRAVSILFWGLLILYSAVFLYWLIHGF